MLSEVIIAGLRDEEKREEERRECGGKRRTGERRERGEGG